jgi:hypothetical protein
MQPNAAAAAAAADAGTKFIRVGDAGVDRRVIYECNFVVDPKDGAAFLAYMRDHTTQIIRLEDGNLFDRADICTAETEGSHDSDKLTISVRYRARSRFRLQEYFDRAGERLRADMTQAWGGRFTVQRRILAMDTVIE